MSTAFVILDSDNVLKLLGSCAMRRVSAKETGSNKNGCCIVLEAARSDHRATELEDRTSFGSAS